jgi:hypothetical protein
VGEGPAVGGVSEKLSGVVGRVANFERPEVRATYSESGMWTSRSLLTTHELPLFRSGTHLAALTAG